VQVVVYDDESNPDTGRVLAERLIDRDAVLAILGPYSSPITDAMATATERAQIPMIGTIASDSSIWSRRKLHWSFQGFPSSDYDLAPISPHLILNFIAEKVLGLPKSY
jgi:branched-chain amino acid transport system substrate-binding protein